MHQSEPHIFHIRDTTLSDFIGNHLRDNPIQKPMLFLEYENYAGDLKQIRSIQSEHPAIEIFYFIKESIDFEKIDARYVDHVVSLSCPKWQDQTNQIFRILHAREQGISPRDLAEKLGYSWEFTPRTKGNFEAIKATITEIVKTHFPGGIDINKVLITYTEIIQNCIFHGFCLDEIEKYSPETFRVLDDSDIVWIRVSWNKETFRLEISDNGGNLKSSDIKDKIYKNNHPIEHHLENRGRGIALTQKFSQSLCYFLISSITTHCLVDFYCLSRNNQMFSVQNIV